MFEITMNKGFHMKFANGFSVSVQWGLGNYCANKWGEGRFGEPVPACPDAEVAAFDPEGNIINLATGDQVVGWLTADEVLTFMTAVAALSADNIPNKLLIAEK
jgi:hypothetical protein